MNETNQGMGMGINSIWDLFALGIVGRMFGLSFGGNDQNAVPAATTAAATEADIERAIRNSQDLANTNAAIAAIAQKQNECCCETKLGQKDIINGQTMIADAVSKAVSEIIGNQSLVALQSENRELARNLNVAENALNNCNQTAAFTSAINEAVAPINAAVAGILGQLNCGVKSVPYTASVPAYLPPMPGSL